MVRAKADPGGPIITQRDTHTWGERLLLPLLPFPDYPDVRVLVLPRTDRRGALRVGVGARLQVGAARPGRQLLQLVYGRPVNGKVQGPWPGRGGYEGPLPRTPYAPSSTNPCRPRFLLRLPSQAVLPLTGCTQALRNRLERRAQPPSLPPVSIPSILLSTDGYSLTKTPSQPQHVTQPPPRPDYRRLGVLRQSLPGVPLVALTATATPRVRDDIVRNLGMAPGTRCVRRAHTQPTRPCQLPAGHNVPPFHTCRNFLPTLRAPADSNPMKGPT